MCKNGILGTRPVLVVLFLAFLFFSGCDLLDNKPEIGLEETIDDAIAWANASRLTVRV